MGPSEAIHEQFSKWAHKTTVSFKGKTKEQAKSYCISSIGELEKLINGSSRISRIAAPPTQKELKRLKGCLPNIPLAADEMLALVDSGSTINAAWIAAHFPQYAKLIIASKAQALGESATTAGGHELRNEGRCRVEASVEGDDFPIAFQNMRVDVPILSVRKYVKGGWDFKFSEADGGSMTCRQNGKVFHFIEADGAFWVKLKVSPPSNIIERPSSGFTRPGTP